MPRIYQLSGYGSFAGTFQDIAEDAGVPAGWATLAPPDTPASHTPIWRGDRWALVEMAPPTEPDPQAQRDAFNAGQRAARAEAYRNETDPLFFKVQRGEATQAEWIAAVEAVKARFPYAADHAPVENS